MTEVSKQKIQRFKKHRRAYFSLWLLVITFVLSLFAELLCNNKPLILIYKNTTYFPALKFYPASTFGEAIAVRMDYKTFVKSDRFKQAEGSYALFPPVPFGVNESVTELGSPPPTRPTGQNWLGTDDRGRDLLTRLFYGFRNSMLFALATWAISILLGYTLGATQGYFGGRVDLIAQRATEIWTALPFFYVVVFLMARFPPSLSLLVGIWVLFAWMSLASYVRAEVLRVRKLDYVMATRALGASHTRILFTHILPNSLTPILTLSPFLISGSISGLAALDYLGLGLPPPSASWGELLRQGKENLESWWLVIYPFLALFISVLLVNFIGEGIRNSIKVKQVET